MRMCWPTKKQVFTQLSSLILTSYSALQKFYFFLRVLDTAPHPQIISTTLCLLCTRLFFFRSLTPQSAHPLTLPSTPQLPSYASIRSLYSIKTLYKGVSSFPPAVASPYCRSCRCWTIFKGSANAGRSWTLEKDFLTF